MIESILRICALDLIFEYLYDSTDSIFKLVECNRDINELITKKMLKTFKFYLTDILDWRLDRLTNIERLRVNVSVNTNLLFFSQLFPKLKSLTFEENVVGLVTKNMFPNSLVKLNMWLTGESKITTNSFPDNLKILKFGYQFNQELSHILPPNLTKLHLGNDFNQPLSKGDLPDTLINLTFGKKFNQPICEGVVPSKLIKLKFGEWFNKPIGKGVLPDTITKLSFGDEFNQTPIKDFLPSNLTEVTFGISFLQPITQNMFPITIRQIRLWEIKNNSNENNMQGMIRTKINTRKLSNFLERVQYSLIDS